MPEFKKHPRKTKDGQIHQNIVAVQTSKGGQIQQNIVEVQTSEGGQIHQNIVAVLLTSCNLTAMKEELLHQHHNHR